MSKLIVSLTSYPARINSVNVTIESLLKQTHPADKVILWLAPEQFPNREGDLPQKLLDLKKHGLTIGWHHDIRSYKKLIPALKMYPDDVIITADDDIIYSPTMIQKLWDSYCQYPTEIQAHRITKFVYENNDFDAIPGGKQYYRSSFLNKLTGCGGVLYPPRCMNHDVLNEQLFMHLAPTNDDQWFWLMAVLNDTKIRVVKGNQYKLNYVPNTQMDCLSTTNDGDDNLFWRDFSRIIKYYPILKTKLINAVRQGKIFTKETSASGRTRIYIYGKKVFSYGKRHLSKKASFNLVRYVSEDRLPIFLRDRFFERTGKLPTSILYTLNEKIIWASMFDVTKLKVTCTDKFAVREYVKNTIGDKYLPKLYAVYKSSDDFDICKLPDKFLLTYNIGANGEYMKFVNKKSEIREYQIKALIQQWLMYNHSEASCEMQYRYIEPCVIARELLDIRTDIEYKLWCFGGKVEFICLNCYNRGHDSVGQAVYDRNWNKLDFYQADSNGWQIQENIQRPDFLNELLKITEKLAQPFNFVRVDFYETTDGKIMFGELTFSPTGGGIEFAPDNAALQYKYGALFQIPERDKDGFAIR